MQQLMLPERSRKQDSVLPVKPLHLPLWVVLPLMLQAKAPTLHCKASSQEKRLLCEAE